VGTGFSLYSSSRFMSSKSSLDDDPSFFYPTDPWKSRDLVARRRKLPHLEVRGATYFVTFRCRSNVKLEPEAQGIVIAAIRTSDGTSIALDAAVVMPDHVHAIFRIIDPYTLSQVLQQLKGRSSRQINQTRKCCGSIWLVESFDHIIRHVKELEEKIEYIRQNPVTAGLERFPENYRWLYIKGITG
jgi:REP element-mobilizing transposase RayT